MSRAYAFFDDLSAATFASGSVILAFIVVVFDRRFQARRSR